MEGSHNLTGRRWAPQQYGIYNYAPRYYFLTEVPTPCRSRYREMAGSWNAVGRELRYVEGTGYTHYIKVEYRALTWPFDTWVALTFFNATGDIEYAVTDFNSSITTDQGKRYLYCGTGAIGDAFDFRWAALHEMGHTQEQLHTANTPTENVYIMYCCVYPGLSKHTLQNHDKQSLSALYPAAT